MCTGSPGDDTDDSEQTLVRTFQIIGHIGTTLLLTGSCLYFAIRHGIPLYTYVTRRMRMIVSNFSLHCLLLYITSQSAGCSSGVAAVWQQCRVSGLLLHACAVLPQDPRQEAL